MRINGLDTLRALAIILVLLTHYEGFVARGPLFGVPGAIGWSGVDLFFVLSGYLIGNQVFSTFARKEAFSLKAFFARRLLRTLPNYYVVLAIYFLFPADIAGTSIAPLWRFLTFTQNIGQAYGETFTHSWSLCIEEQFYLLLPLVAILVARCANSVRVAWWSMGGAMAIAVAWRSYAFLVNGNDPGTAEIYYSSLGRFDELLPGVAIAMLKNFHGALFERLQKRHLALLLAGLACAAGILFSFGDDHRNSLPVAMFGYPMLAISYAMLVFAALSPGSLLNRVRIPGAAQVALWSYAIYLAHKPIFMAISAHLKRSGMDGAAPMTVVLVMSAGIVGGWLLYRLVEHPFMLLRARWYPPTPLRVSQPSPSHLQEPTTPPPVHPARAGHAVPASRQGA